MSIWTILFCVWGPWITIEEGDIACNGKKRGNYIVQKRTCSNCKKEELRTVKTY